MNPVLELSNDTKIYKGDIMMNQLNSTRKTRTFKHLSLAERGMLAAFLCEGRSVSYISKKLGRSRTTIYNEIKRGTVTQIVQNKYVEKYLPDAGQAKYEDKRKNSYKSFKLNKCFEFISFVIHKFNNSKWSLDACSGYASVNKLFDDTVCTKTLYNYINKGLISIKNVDLPLKLKRSTSKKTITKVHKRKLGRSISERPLSVDSRKEFGHWELDTVLGGKTKNENCVFSLIERKTRYYLPIKISFKNSLCIKDAFTNLIAKFGSKAFEIFKSITCDNGSEFSEMYTFGQFLEVYFAHPFSSFERGSNERHNGLLRNFLPKGKSMNSVSKEQIFYYGDLINGLPRKIFNYRTPEELFEEELDRIYSVF